MGEWRECRLAGRFIRHRVEWLRFCHLHKMETPQDEGTCAACPVPALVEAVEAGASKLPSCAMIREGKEWSFRSVVEVREQCEAALAAVKKGA